MKINVSAKDIGFVAIFAALSAAIIRFLPGIPIIGVPGTNIKLDAALAPIYGLVIGPYLGFIAALIGGLLTAGNSFDILTSFSPAVSALVAGLLTQKGWRTGSGRVSGWMVALFVLGLLIVGWYSTSIGQRALLYPILHLAGFGLIIITRGWIARAFKSVETKVTRSFFLLAVAISSYCGIIADHMLGNLVFVNSIGIFIPVSWLEESVLKPLGLPDVSSLFLYTIPISAIERLTLTAIATALGVGLVLALRRANIEIRTPRGET